MSRDRLVQDQRREIDFLQKLVDKHRKEVIELTNENKMYRDLVRNRVKVAIERYDSSKFDRVRNIVRTESLLMTKERGTWFHWKEMYDRLLKKYRKMPWNPRTVERRLQEACEEGLLTRVKRGTYIYNIHRDEGDQNEKNTV